MRESAYTHTLVTRTLQEKQQQHQQFQANKCNGKAQRIQRMKQITQKNRPKRGKNKRIKIKITQKNKTMLPVFFSNEEKYDGKALNRLTKGDE